MKKKRKKKKNSSHICKWTFIETKDQRTLNRSGNSSSEHIMSQDLACIFDAEKGTKI